MTQPSLNKKDSNDPDEKEPMPIWVKVLIIISIFAGILIIISFLAYYYIKKQAIQDYKDILDCPDIRNTYKNMYLPAIETMMKCIKSKKNTMELEDLLNYLHRLETGTCKNCNELTDPVYMELINGWTGGARMNSDDNVFAKRYYFY